MADKRVTFLINANIRNFERNLSRAQKSFRKFGTNLKKMGRTLTTSVTLPIGIAGVAVVKMAADFEKSFSKIEGLVGIARNEVQAFTGDVLNLAVSAGRGPRELAEAMFFVTSSGMRGAEALGVLKLSAEAAASGLGHTEVVADLVTSAMNAYGPAVLSAQQATDALIATIREGKRPPQEIAESIGMVLPMASEMGVTFQQVGAAIAAMSRTGTKAQTAVVQLRQVLLTILQPAEGAKLALKDMGTSAAEMRREIKEKGLLAFLGFLREEMKNNSQAFTDVFGNVRALSGALDIMGKNAKVNAGIFERMKNNVGDADKAFAAASQTVSFKFNQALSGLKVIGIEMGNLLLPIVAKLLEKIKEGIKWFRGLSSETKKLTLFIFGLAAALGPALIVLGTLAFVIGSISLPIIGVIAAIAALGAAFLWVAENWEAIIERISDWNWWKNMLIDMAQFMLKWNVASLMIDGWNWLVKQIPDMWETVVKFVSDVNWWKEMLVKMGRLFLDTNPFVLLFKAIEFLVGFDYSGIFDGITKGLDEVEKSINKNIRTPLQIVNPFEVVSDGLESLRGKTVIYKHEFTSFADAMANAFNEAKQAALGFFDSAGGGVAAPKTPTSTGLPQWQADLVSTMKGFDDIPSMELPSLHKGTEHLKAFADSARDAESASNSLGQALQSSLTSAVTGFAETLGNVLVSGGNIFTVFFKVLGSFMKSLGAAIVAVGFTMKEFKKALQTLNWKAVVIAGAALIVAGAVVTSIASKGPKGMAKGGIVPPGFPNDTFPAMLTSKEVVLPSPQSLPDFGGGGGFIADVRFPMRDFVIAFRKEEAKMNRG